MCGHAIVPIILVFIIAVFACLIPHVQDQLLICYPYFTYSYYILSIFVFALAYSIFPCFLFLVEFRPLTPPFCAVSRIFPTFVIILKQFSFTLLSCYLSRFFICFGTVLALLSHSPRFLTPSRSLIYFLEHALTTQTHAFNALSGENSG